MDSKHLKIEVSYGRPGMTDNRMVIFDGENVIGVVKGSRTDLVKEFNKALKRFLEPHAVEKLQSHTLPNYVKDYFGTRDVEMTRHSLGFCFRGPKFYVVIQKKHAEAARRGVIEYVKKRRKK